jgi:uncharacterized protein (DUF302 family)
VRDRDIPTKKEAIMMNTRRTIAAAAVGLVLAVTPVTAQNPSVFNEQGGWVVRTTAHSYPDLVARLEKAIAANKMGQVNAASASDGARAQGFTIPGNRVVGVFRNDFARRMLAASVQAGIEAPVRFYVTEGSDQRATLSYRTPGAVFAPYLDRAGPDLKAVATELDAIFARIFEDATAP